MQQVTFTLRTLTPLFLAGADQTRAELRAPTFRGLMRYWYRALIGGLVGTSEEGIKIVVGKESQIFGSTSAGSAVNVRVSTNQQETISYRREGTGKDYLLWSMNQFADKQRRRYYPQETEFQVTLSIKDDDNNNLEQAFAAFWLLTQLGGIGSRSRRCAGSVTVRHIEGNIGIQRLEQLPSFAEQPSKEALQKQIGQGIRIARELSKVGAIAVKDATFDVIAPDTCLIRVLHDNGKAWDTADQAMDAVGSDLRMYRSSIQPRSARKAFGFPLKDVSADNERRASSLLLRVTKLQGEQYVVVAILFKTLYEDIESKDNKVIEDWINGFSKRLR